MNKTSVAVLIDAGIRKVSRLIKSRRVLLSSEESFLFYFLCNVHVFTLCDMSATVVLSFLGGGVLCIFTRIHQACMYHVHNNQSLATTI